MKQTTSHATMIAISGPTTFQPAPRSMLARSASFTAVSGSADDRLQRVGKALAEKKTPGEDPHRQHHQVHQAGAASMVWARDAISNPRAREGERRQQADQSRGASSEPRTGTPNTSAAEAQQQAAPR